MSKFFINRPIVAMVISIITVIVGLVTLFTLPIAQFPKIIPPEIFVEAHYVGADARTIYEVLEAQQQLFPAELNLARVERDQLLAIVALYKALGGGWQDDLSGKQGNKTRAE